ALGRGCGPLVVTAGSADRARLPAARVAVPGDRTTAYLLFRLWSAGAPPGRGDVVPFDRIMPGVAAGRYDGGLVIHEGRFTYPSYGLSCLADLGEWWEAETGLPIPLGAILARRGWTRRGSGRRPGRRWSTPGGIRRPAPATSPSTPRSWRPRCSASTSRCM